jgi:hypothetical protein
VRFGLPAPQFLTTLTKSGIASSSGHSTELDFDWGAEASGHLLGASTLKAFRKFVKPQDTLICVGHNPRSSRASHQAL